MIQKTLIIIGVLFILVGLLYPFILDIGLGSLPGDIVIKKENSSFYFPTVTCIVISAVVSLILMFFKKITKKPYLIKLKIVWYQILNLGRLFTLSLFLLNRYS